MTNELSLIIGGFAGQGVQTAAETFGRMCARAGLHVFMNHEYPSNIKGEHTYSHVMVSAREVRSSVRSADVLLALDAKTVVLHQDKLRPGGALIHDREGAEISPIDKGRIAPDIKRTDLTAIDVPFAQIAREIGGTKKVLNSAGLGAVQGLLRFDFEELAGMIRRSLAKLGGDVVAGNLRAARQAYDEVLGKFGNHFRVVLERRDGPRRMLLTGNQALGIGALKAGLKAYYGYPMSPSSSLLSFLTRHAKDYGMIAMLTEDEISAIGMACGAAFAGVRAMTGTSGGGFCLQSEHYGLAGMCEIPLVVMDAQRPGPATGLPTRTEQGDLRFALHAHQGEFPRIVLAPGDLPEVFRLGFEAFNLADRYQTVVLLLMDKHLCESHWTCEPFDTTGLTIDRGEILGEDELHKMGDYKRFRVTESGISPRTRPGTPGGVFRVTGNEHDEHGDTSEEAGHRVAQVAKRLRKLNSLDVSEIGVKLHGDADADLTLVGWGSTKSVILDALALLKERRGLRANFLQVIFMNPFPAARVGAILKQAKRTLAVELNPTGQLAGLIAEKTGFFVHDKLLKWDGRQFHKDELAELIEARL